MDYNLWGRKTTQHLNMIIIQKDNSNSIYKIATYDNYTGCAGHRNIK
jgi:hypothetical protein